MSEQSSAKNAALIHDHYVKTSMALQEVLNELREIEKLMENEHETKLKQTELINPRGALHLVIADLVRKEDSWMSYALARGVKFEELTFRK